MPCVASVLLVSFTHLLGEQLAAMTDFHLKRLSYNLTSTAGLALIGQLLKKMQITQTIDPVFPIRGAGGIANSDILKSYLGLLCLGKTDFDAIEAYRQDTFFAHALGLRATPSSSTLRQRLDEQASQWFSQVDTLNETLLKSGKAEFRALACGWVPLDLDVFPMDNSATKKEGVSHCCPTMQVTRRASFDALLV
jgi:hypothetical protein